MKRLFALALLGLVVFVGCNSEEAAAPAEGGAAVPATGAETAPATTPAE